MEIWKIIPYEQEYAVSNYGRVKNIKTNLVKSIRLDRYGYPRVTLYPSGKTYTIHRLVMTVFVPNPENKPTVNHIDGNKENNHLSNLEWATASEQAIHFNRVILKPEDKRWLGEDNPGNVYPAGLIREIKFVNWDGFNNSEIARYYDVPSELVRLVRNGSRWNHLEDFPYIYFE